MWSSIVSFIILPCKHLLLGQLHPLGSEFSRNNSPGQEEDADGDKDHISSHFWDLITGLEDRVALWPFWNPQHPVLCPVQIGPQKHLLWSLLSWIFIHLLRWTFFFFLSVQAPKYFWGEQQFLSSALAFWGLPTTHLLHGVCMSVLPYSLHSRDPFGILGCSPQCESHFGVKSTLM